MSRARANLARMILAPKLRRLLAAALCWYAVNAGAQESAAALLAAVAADEIDQWYGVYVGTTNIGTMHFVGTRLPEGAQLEVETRMLLGPALRTAVERLRFDNDGILVSYDADAREGQEDGANRNVFSLTAGPAGYHWTRDRTTSGVTLNTDGQINLPNGLVPNSVAALVAARMDWEASSGSLDVPVLDEDEMVGATSALVVAATREITVDGRPATLYRVEVRDPTDDQEVYFEVAAGLARRMVLNPEPLVQAVAGSREQALADLDSGETPQQAAVRTAASDFLLAFLTGDAEQLMDLVEWAELKRRFAQADASVQAVTVEAFAALMVDAAVRRAEAGGGEGAQQQVGVLRGLLEVLLDGQDARVGFPGRDQPMEFRRGADGRWRLWWWDVFLASR